MIATAKPETYWNVSLAFTRPDGHTAGGMSFGENTLPVALAEVYRYGTYYHARGYSITADLEEHCHACQGLGMTSGKRGKRVKCPICKGKGVFQVIDAFPLAPHDTTSVVSLDT